jgi:hypothetical protein
MHRFSLIHVVVTSAALLFVALGLPPGVAGAECDDAKDTREAPTSHPDTSDWQPLLKPDLSNAQGAKKVWQYKDGILTASKDKMLWTKKVYGDYVLDLEFKMGKAANSGVIIDCSDVDNWIPNSIEVQILHDEAEKWSDVAPTWHCGAIFGHKAPKKNAAQKPGKWNRYTITVRGPMIYVVLNDELVNVMDRRRYTSAKKNPDGSNIPPWLSKPVADLPQRGHIGLQGKHGGAPIYFRNMRIKTLPQKK